MFTDKEIAYLKSQPLARLATVDQDLQPDASPVGFKFDGQVFSIIGHNLTATRKYINIDKGYTKVALVVDDLESVNPWRPRGIRIFGIADILKTETGASESRSYIRVRPTISWSWNVESSSFVDGQFKPRRTVHKEI